MCLLTGKPWLLLVCLSLLLRLLYADGAAAIFSSLRCNVTNRGQLAACAKANYANINHVITVTLLLNAEAYNHGETGTLHLYLMV